MLTSRERVAIALHRGEPDRVPLFEIGINNQVAEYFLGRKEYVFGSGSTTMAAIEAELRGPAEYRAFMDRCYQNGLEIYSKAGLDMICIFPTGFVTPLNFGLHNVGVRDIYDIDIVRESPTMFRLVSKDPAAPDFWCTCAFSPVSDTFQMHNDNINTKGESEFARYVEYLEKKPLDQIPQPLQFGLDGLEHAIKTNHERYNLFLLGYGDIEYPCFQTYHALYLHLMMTNPELVHRYMRATTDSIMTMLRIELEMGVDGVLGANDWAYKIGPLVSPAQFDEFMGPYLREIIDLTHSYGKPYVRHLDGNTTVILDSLVDKCKIDAYHAIEPPAGMDIAKIKRQYGDRITVIGNIDCGEILTNWSPEQIRQEVRRIIRTVSPGGGHIFGSSNAIHGGISVENFKAYVAAAMEFGVYPIQVD